MTAIMGRPDEPTPLPPPSRRPAGRRAYAVAAGVLVLCIAAFALRDELRGRYWAGRVVAAESVEERAAALDRVVRLGDSARWGINYLLRQPGAELRQFGYLALHGCGGEWARQRFLAGLADPSPYVREVAALGVASLRVPGDVQRLAAEVHAGGELARMRGVCAALERIGDADALAALHTLLGADLPVEVTAAVIDALASIGSPESVPALLARLDDARLTATPPRYETLALGASLDVSRPLAVDGETSQAIGARAAAALTRITGIPEETPATAEAGAPAAPRDRWRRWWEEWRRQNPQGP